VFKADLHIHSSASDGRYSPAEIVSKAVASGLTLIALTDHDTVDGIAPALSAAREFPGLTVIPGVEISTDISNGEVHMLGYFIDYTRQSFKASLAKMRNSRLERARKMVEKLRDLGCNIEWERVREIAGKATLGRPHIAQALLEKGYIRDFKEAFSKYIGQGGPAYVEREKLTPAEAVQLVLQANGLPVMAHPFTAVAVEEIVKELKAVGLVGIETYYAGYSPEDVNSLLRMADKYNLVPTGGTDYHGIDDTAEVALGKVDVPERFVKELFSLAEKRGLKTVSLHG
jgi:predicted metal-dependent phosphoesterase TrpH